MASPDDSSASETSFKFQLKTAVTTLGREKKPSLVRVLLGLPRAKKAFQTIRGRFAALDVDGDGVISLEELSSACWVASLTDPTLLALYFEQADIDHSSGIDLDEFVLLNSFLFFLGDDAKAEAEGAPTPDDPVEVEIRFAFVAAASAFCCFDLNDDGVVERDEITTALSGPRGGGGAFITPERMEELDWDKNGTVSFKEFLLAFVKWSGVDDGDDES